MLALQRACGNRAVSSLMRQARTGGRVLQRQPLDVTGADQIATDQGTFLRFPNRGHHTNQTDRPRFLRPRTDMQEYQGAGNNGSEVIHPAVATALDTLMQALLAEGNRLGDESMRQAVVASAWRPSALSEGRAYLRSLRRTITQHPDELPNPFPESLVETAQSELGTVGSAAHNEFRAALARAPGWDQAQADFLIRETGRFKAPRGGSTHHSGVVADINFPYATAGGRVQWHGMDRARNADAFRSAAGQWLAQHAPALGFDTYDTSAEIWHQEWRNWAGTAADPNAPAAAAGGAAAPAAGGGAAAPAQAPAAGELQDTDIARLRKLRSARGPRRCRTCSRGDERPAADRARRRRRRGAARPGAARAGPRSGGLHPRAAARGREPGAAAAAAGAEARPARAQGPGREQGQAAARGREPARRGHRRGDKDPERATGRTPAGRPNRAPSARCSGSCSTGSRVTQREQPAQKIKPPPGGPGLRGCDRQRAAPGSGDAPSRSSRRI